jgi:phage tail sheath protein FI
MPEYLSPGVYVEEVDAGPKPIEGVSTSTAGAVGVTSRGPDTGKPLLVTSFAEYMRTFGGPIVVDEVVKATWSGDPEKGEFWTFPLAVKGFFDNGGQRLYVRRIVSKTSTASGVTLGQGVMAFVTKNALDGTRLLALDSLIGIEAGTAMALVVDGTPLPVTVASYDSAAHTVTLTADLPKRVHAHRDFVQVQAAKGESIKIVARSVGDWGNAISVRAQPMDAGAFAVMSDPAIANNASMATAISVDEPADNKFTVTSAVGIAVGDFVLVDGKQYKVATVAGAVLTVELPIGTPTWKKDWKVVPGLSPSGANATTIAADATGASFDVASVGSVAKGDNINVNGVPYRITALAGNAFTVERIQPWKKGWAVIRVRYAAKALTQTPTLYVWGASSLYKNAFVEIEDVAKGKKYYGQVTTITNNKVTIGLPVAPAALDLLEGQRIHLIEGKFDILYAPKDGPASIETIANVRFAEAEPGDPMYVEHRLGAVSHLVHVASPPAISIGGLDEFPLAVDDPTVNGPAALTWAKLDSGSDDFGSLDPDAFVGQDLGPGKRSGIQALEDIDDISITMVPSIWSSLVQNALIQQAETLKYRFAILDPRPVRPTDDDVIGEIRAFREGFDTKYAALYFPRLEVNDPFTDKTVGLGPSGHMAGIYARVDVERGVHKAPANEVIRGIDTANGFHGLEVEVTKREQDLLNPKGINALRFFPNRGTRVWGARTLSSDGSWKYINVRRIFIWVERSIDEGTQWVVFEPNDEKTWARVRQSIANFLTTVWRSGALFGTKAEEAFFVRCDRTTMSQDDIDNGRLICVIGIAPVKPAEFVIFRIQQKLIDQKAP